MFDERTLKKVSNRLQDTGTVCNMSLFCVNENMAEGTDRGPSVKCSCTLVFLRLLREPWLKMVPLSAEHTDRKSLQMGATIQIL